MSASFVLVILFNVLILTTVHVKFVSLGRVEVGSFRFHYDPETHILVGHNTAECYLVKLTIPEMDAVHTDKGMEMLELTMMREWLGVCEEIPIYRTDPGISENIYRWCQNQLIYFLKRPLNNTTIPKTIVPPSQSVTTMTSGVSVTNAGTVTYSKVDNSGSTPSYQTTSLPAPSATSHHAMPLITPGLSIFYINSNPMRAVIISSHICYVYTLTDIEMALINKQDVQATFERALLSKDRTLATPYTEHDPTINQQLHRHCDGTILQL